MIEPSGALLSLAEVYLTEPPSAESRSIRAPAPDDHDKCLTAALRALWSELGADGLLVSRHSIDDEPLVLFSAGACASSIQHRRSMASFSAQLAESCAGSFEAVTSEGLSSDGKLCMLAIPLADGVVTVTALFEGEAAQRPGTGEPLLRYRPMLQPFFRLWAASRKVSARFAGLTTAVNNWDAATFVVGRGGELLFANEMGERLFALHDGVERRGGKLCGATLADTLRLHAAIDHVFSAPANGQVSSILALRRTRRRPLMVTLLAAATEGVAQRRDVAVAYVFDPELDLTRLIEPACKFYGLSASETRLTCRLASGATLMEAAKALGVREQTARSCLKQIFLKTETNRQAELVWLMLKSAVHVSHPDGAQMF